MVRLFRIHNRRRLAHGLIEVKHASSDQIPYPNAHFDRSYAVHTLYFWKDPFFHLAEIRRVTRLGGRFVLTFTPKEDAEAIASFPDTVYSFRSIEEVTELLQRAGFGKVEVRREKVGSKDVAFAIAGC